jgi:hypothetical protein
MHKGAPMRISFFSWAEAPKAIRHMTISKAVIPDHLKILLLFILEPPFFRFKVYPVRNNALLFSGRIAF